MYIPLHKLWTSYISQLLGTITPITDSSSAYLAQTHQLPKLLKADFHGAYFTVIRSKCPSYVRVNGIMIKETEGIFIIITKDNQVKCKSQERRRRCSGRKENFSIPFFIFVPFCIVIMKCF